MIQFHKQLHFYSEEHHARERTPANNRQQTTEENGGFPVPVVKPHGNEKNRNIAVRLEKNMVSATYPKALLVSQNKAGY